MTAGIVPRPRGGLADRRPDTPCPARSPLPPARTLLTTSRWPLLAALVFLLAHLPFLAPTLDDIDAVNFAFGVRRFDPAAHHPHPPGYPVYIALGKISTAAMEAVVPEPGFEARLERDPAALALALWSVLFGALGVLAWYALFLQLELLAASEVRSRAGPPPGAAPDDGRRRASRIAAGAAIFAAAAPLVWLTSARPMSDVPGLVAATIAQALLLVAWRRENEASSDGAATATADVWLPSAALAASLALGIRSQVLWLTLPLFVAVLVARARRLGLSASVSAIVAYAAGIVLWVVPMVVATGGWQRYLAALGSQGAEDFTGVDMLWTHMGVRRFLVGLAQTFVLPWSSIPLALLVVALAAAGVVSMLRRARAALALLALLCVPYALFHTLFHETVTTRYALPLVPPVCYLAFRAAAQAGKGGSRRTQFAAAAVPVVLVVWSLAVAVPALHAYASKPVPIFRALAEMERRSEAWPAETTALGMHRRISTESRSALNWAADTPWSMRLPSPRSAEWGQARDVLREEPDTTVWFLAEPARAGEFLFRDLALVDPRARALVGRYSLGDESSGLLDGARPSDMDLYEIKRPGWIAGEGWALTPETAGIAARDRVGPSYRPIEALVRRRAQETVLLIGGRHLASEADGPARIEVRIDGRLAREFLVQARPRFFLEMFHLPAGALAGPGPFASLSIRALAGDGSARLVPAAIEQFDLQGVDGVVYGYGTGWQEAEYDPGRQRLWRWMSERATVLVHAGGSRPLTLHVTAESPRRYFDRPAEFRVRVGETVLARLVPDARLPRLLARATGGSVFTLALPIRRDLLAAAAGQITLEADQFFVPAAAGRSGDQRHLSVRILGLSID